MPETVGVLEVQIRANTQPLEAALSRTRSEADKFEQSLTKTRVEADRLGRLSGSGLRTIGGDLDKASVAATRFNTSLSSTATATHGFARSMMTSFAGVAAAAESLS